MRIYNPTLLELLDNVPRDALATNEFLSKYSSFMTDHSKRLLAEKQASSAYRSKLRAAITDFQQRNSLFENTFLDRAVTQLETCPSPVVAYTHAATNQYLETKRVPETTLLALQFPHKTRALRRVGAGYAYASWAQPFLRGDAASVLNKNVLRAQRLDAYLQKAYLGALRAPKLELPK